MNQRYAPRIRDRLLRIFRSNEGELITRDELVRNFWGGHDPARSLDVHIYHARRELTEREEIVSVKGKGYKYECRE